MKNLKPLKTTACPMIKSIMNCCLTCGQALWHTVKTQYRSMGLLGVAYLSLKWLLVAALARFFSLAQLAKGLLIYKAVGFLSLGLASLAWYCLPLPLLQRLKGYFSKSSSQ